MLSSQKHSFQLVGGMLVLINGVSFGNAALYLACMLPFFLQIQCACMARMYMLIRMYGLLVCAWHASVCTVMIGRTLLGVVSLRYSSFFFTCDCIHISVRDRVVLIYTAHIADTFFVVILTHRKYRWIQKTRLSASEF